MTQNKNENIYLGTDNFYGYAISEFCLTSAMK